MQLVSMDWKLGVSISSSSCRALNSPHVSLLLKVADPGGSVQQHSAEMSVSEFQVSHTISQFQVRFQVDMFHFQVCHVHVHVAYM